MSKKSTKTVNASVKFVESSDIPGTMKSVIFTPENWNGKYKKVRLYDACSCISAIQEYLGQTVVSAGKFLHVRSGNYSSVDGVDSFYIGGGMVLSAIEDGLRSISVNIGDEQFEVFLPATDVNIGHWAQAKTRLGNKAGIVPCEDAGHVSNMDKKHEALELLFRGTKLVIFTEPCLTKKGEVFVKASDAAKVLRERILNAEGAIKTPAEIAEAYFAPKREYAASNKLNANARRIAKVAPVLNLTVGTVIKVDGEPVSVTAVPAGRYTYQENGVDKIFTHIRNLDSQNALTLLASRGRELVTQRKF